MQTNEDRDVYNARKTKLVEQLKQKIDALSQKMTKQPFHVEVEKLTDANYRGDFMMKMRDMGIGHLEISKHLINLESDEILKRNLLGQTKTTIRLYMISAFDCASRDNGSASDTYLVLKCNGQTYNERDNYQLDEPNPDFYKMYDFEGMFPDSSPLEIAVWDYDVIFGDELVGTTSIDVEDRYFSVEWNSLADKPIEYRQLYHPSSSMSQGVVKCWLEIIPTTIDPEYIKVWDIAPKDPYEIEIRICVLNCRDIVMMDAEGTSDVFFKGFFDQREETQETDTHFRNQDGKPDFQYRLVYRIAYPRKGYKFTL